jgi:tRNA (mo5U34)-methyltransferase
MAEADYSNIRWFHSFDLGNGEIIDGIKPLDVLMREADAILGPDLTGKTILDIGAWDGFFSFEAERRGASRVVATDHFCWSGQGWGNRQGFDYIRARRNSTVEAVDVDVPNLGSAGLGQFDTVLFLGVMYHLKDPYVGLEAAAAMSRDHIVVETVTAFHAEKLPAIRLFADRELDDDPTNYCAPNPPALELMLRACGFNRIELAASPVSYGNPLSKKWLKRSDPSAVHRTIAHAWRQ